MTGALRLTDAEAGELLTLQRAAYVTEAQSHDDPWLPPLVESLADLRRVLADPSVTTMGLRDVDARLVASVRVTRSACGGRAELARLMVAPDRQGAGLGSRLLAAAEECLPGTTESIHLFTGEHSPANLRLYARHGYEDDGREQTSAGYAVVHLVKRLR